MTDVWTWAFRNPLLLVAVLALAAGAAGIVTWGLSLMTALVAAFGASLADRLARRGRARQRRAEEARLALDEAAKLRDRAVKERATRRVA